MNIVRISKANGSFRTIYVPNTGEKALLRAAFPAVMDAARSADKHQVQHGFTTCRSPITNAAAHLGWRFSLCFDLSDFFDHVKPSMVDGKFGAPMYWPDGAARQGLPTSPAMANLAASPMDSEIMSHQSQSRFGRNFVYTRYADDLTFSYNMEHIGAWLRREIPKIVERHGFRINPIKTKSQCEAAGARHITGVAVDGMIIRPTREVKRRLRAAQHALKTGGIGKRALRRLIAKQQEIERRTATKLSLRTLLKSQAEGLAEWIKLKPPKQLIQTTSQTTATLTPTKHGTEKEKPGIGQRKLILD